MNLSVNKLFVRCLGVMLLMGSLFGMSGCKDEVDTSNMFTATEQSIFEYIDSVPEYSSMAYIFRQVKLGDDADASTLASVLSAYGNYTCFLANDSAMAQYVSSLHPDTTEVQYLTYEEMQQVAYSCVIDNGISTAYTYSNFQSDGSLPLANLADRNLTVRRDTSDHGIYVNGTSKLTSWNISTSNGYIHTVNNVISPSTSSVAELLGQAGNMRVMSYLLDKTGWYATIDAADYDREYEEVEREEYETNVISSQLTTRFAIPQRRYLGYTLFSESDDVFARALGVSIPEETLTDNNMTQVMSALRAKAEAVYGTEAQEDMTDPRNAINRFVAYHLLAGRFPYNDLVRHYNEYQYSWGADALEPQLLNFTVDVWSYYCTAGKDRYLLKILQVPTGNHEMYLNRASEYNDARDGDYREVANIVPGLQILDNNGEYDNNASNGMYFPILDGDKLLMYDDEVKYTVLGGRIRFDLVEMLPELVSTNVRGKRYRGSYNYTVFPNGFFENITDESDETNIAYLINTGAAGWRDYQGDEFLFSGLYDFTLRLPPVPVAGTYEVRMGTSNNPNRGMAQVYFGERGNMQPTGLPIDMRVGTTQEFRTSIGWVPDADAADVNEIIENDKNMRNHDWMKAPYYITLCNGQGDTPLRDNLGGYNTPCMRKIIGRTYMQPGKEYFVRFKTCLNDPTSEFFVDYFEIVPASVYNGSVPEDIW